MARILDFIPRNRNAVAANQRPGDVVCFRSKDGTLTGTIHAVTMRAIAEKYHRRAIVDAYTVSVKGERHHVPPERIIVPCLPEDGVA